MVVSEIERDTFPFDFVGLLLKLGIKGGVGMDFPEFCGHQVKTR